MTTVSTILADLDSALASKSEDRKVRTMTQVTTMFVQRATEYTPEQIGVFDVVIGRLASGVSVQARTDLSERLADLSSAPRGVVRQLALDEIGVARPVLSRSVVLQEQDLITVASTRGRDHMLAITERPGLTEPVTDYLVVKGDRVVSHALANNETARFSGRGMGLLITRAFADEALQSALSVRADIPVELLGNLSNAVRESARRRLLSRTAPAAILSAEQAQPDAGPPPVDPALREAAAAHVQQLVDQGRLNETALAAMASQGDVQKSICALAALTRLSQPAAEQALLGADRDACLVVGKAMDWNFETVKALLTLRPSSEQLPHMLSRAESNFDSLAPATAQRVLQFMRVKDQAGKDQTVKLQASGSAR
jgi:uncharacterized protein (DUF2336 family)